MTWKQAVVAHFVVLTFLEGLRNKTKCVSRKTVSRIRKLLDTKQVWWYFIDTEETLQADRSSADDTQPRRYLAYFWYLVNSNSLIMRYQIVKYQKKGAYKCTCTCICSYVSLCSTSGLCLFSLLTVCLSVCKNVSAARFWRITIRTSNHCMATQNTSLSIRCNQ